MRHKKAFVISVLLLLFYTGSPVLFGSGNIKVGSWHTTVSDKSGNKISNSTDSTTIENKIAPESNGQTHSPHKYQDHTDSYRRALFYINRQTYNTAAAILRNDLKRTKDPYDRYQSYSLLLGLHNDRRVFVSEKELDNFIRRFKKMQARAPRDIKKIERLLERLNRKESHSEGDPEKRRKNRHVSLHIQLHAGQYKNQRENLLKYVNEKKRRVETYETDPFQFERMAGDYFYRQNDTKRAYVLYREYYDDLDRPVSSFVPQSMRNYIDILWKNHSSQTALFYQGFLVNLKPYMFTDLFHLARMYYLLDDRQNSLFLAMFINTLAEGYSIPYYGKSGEQILLLLEEMKNYQQEKSARELAGVYLTGENIRAIHGSINALSDLGVENFFFYYLEGLSLYLKKDYEKALSSFETFNDVYPWLADSYYYAMLCMDRIDSQPFNKKIIDYAQKTAELKPHSFITEMTRLYMGRRMGIDNEESHKLLFPVEITKSIESFTKHGAPVQSLTRLCGLLSISKNPYQALAVQQMSGVTGRRDEYVGFLKETYIRSNDHCRRNIEIIVRALGEEFE